MSNQRHPLFSDAAVDAPRIFDSRHIRDTYEAARVKDADLIQQFYNAARKAWTGTAEMERCIAAAEAAGFKLTEE